MHLHIHKLHIYPYAYTLNAYIYYIMRRTFQPVLRALYSIVLLIKTRFKVFLQSKSSIFIATGTFTYAFSGYISRQ